MSKTVIVTKVAQYRGGLVSVGTVLTDFKLNPLPSWAELVDSAKGKEAAAEAAAAEEAQKVKPQPMGYVKPKEGELTPQQKAAQTRKANAEKKKREEEQAAADAAEKDETPVESETPAEETPATEAAQETEQTEETETEAPAEDTAPEAEATAK